MGLVLSRHLGLDFFVLVLASSVSVFFGFLRFVNLLEIQYFYFYVPKVVSLVVFSGRVDLWVWGASLFVVVLEVLLLTALGGGRFSRWMILPCVLVIGSFSVFLVNAVVASFLVVPLGFGLVGLTVFLGEGYAGEGRRALGFVLLGVAVLVLVFEFGSFLTWVWNVFDYSFPLVSFDHWRFAFVDVGLFYVFYPWTSWLFVLLLYSWIWVPVGKAAATKISPLKEAFSRLSGGVSVGSGRLGRWVLVCGLLLTVCAAVFVCWYPYFHVSSGVLAGSDSVDYYNWLQGLMQNGTSALPQAYPVVVLLMFGVQRISGLSAETVVQVMPALCAVCACLAVFWFVRVSLKNDVLALGAAFLSVVSFQTTVSINAYSLANWWALVFAFVLFGLLLKGFEGRSWRFMLGASVVGMVLLLSHPWTWDVVMAILLGYAGVSLAWSFLKKRPEERREVLGVCLVLGLNLAFFVVYGLLPFGKGVSSASVGTMSSISPGAGFLGLQGGLESMVQLWVGGLFGNPLLVVLAVFGVFCFADFAKRFNRLVLLWVAVPSLALFGVSPSTFYFYRLVYLVPFQVLAAAGLYWIVSRLEKAMSAKKNWVFAVLKIVVITLVVLFLLNYALRSADGTVLHMV